MPSRAPKQLCCAHVLPDDNRRVNNGPPARRGRTASKWDAVASREPIFNVPGAVLAILAVLISVYVALSMMPEEQFTWWILALAFIPARYAGMADALPGGEPAAVTSFVTHMAVHAEITHLVFNSAWLLAFGSVLCARLGGWRFLAFSIAGGIAGALMFLLFNPALAAPVIGASGAIAAMMGGVMRFLFNAIDRGEGYLLRHNPAAIPRVSVKDALLDRRIVFASVVFIALNLLAMLGFGTFGAVSIAWEAHVGGYLFGLLAFSHFDIAMQNDAPPSPQFD